MMLITRAIKLVALKLLRVIAATTAAVDGVIVSGAS